MPVVCTLFVSRVRSTPIPQKKMVERVRWRWPDRVEDLDAFFIQCGIDLRVASFKILNDDLLKRHYADITTETAEVPGTTRTVRVKCLILEAQLVRADATDPTTGHFYPFDVNLRRLYQMLYSTVRANLSYRDTQGQTDIQCTGFLGSPFLCRFTASQTGLIRCQIHREARKAFLGAIMALEWVLLQIERIHPPESQPFVVHHVRAVNMGALCTLGFPLDAGALRHTGDVKLAEAPIRRVVATSWDALLELDDPSDPEGERPFNDNASSIMQRHLTQEVLYCDSGARAPSRAIAAVFDRATDDDDKQHETNTPFFQKPALGLLSAWDWATAAAATAIPKHLTSARASEPLAYVDSSTPGNHQGAYVSRPFFRLEDGRSVITCTNGRSWEQVLETSAMLSTLAARASLIQALLVSILKDLRYVALDGMAAAAVSGDAREEHHSQLVETLREYVVRKYVQSRDSAASATATPHLSAVEVGRAQERVIECVLACLKNCMTHSFHPDHDTSRDYEPACRGRRALTALKEHSTGADIMPVAATATSDTVTTAKRPRGRPRSTALPPLPPSKRRKQAPNAKRANYKKPRGSGFHAVDDVGDAAAAGTARGPSLCLMTLLLLHLPSDEPDPDTHFRDVLASSSRAPSHRGCVWDYIQLGV